MMPSRPWRKIASVDESTMAESARVRSSAILRAVMSRNDGDEQLAVELVLHRAHVDLDPHPSPVGATDPEHPAHHRPALEAGAHGREFGVGRADDRVRRPAPSPCGRPCITASKSMSRSSDHGRPRISAALRLQSRISSGAVPDDEALAEGVEDRAGTIGVPPVCPGRRGRIVSVEQLCHPPVPEPLRALSVSAREGGALTACDD